MNAQGAPGWLSSFDTYIANVIAVNTFSIVVDLVLIQLVVGMGVLLSRRRIQTTAVILGIFASLAFWVVGQSLGEYWTGLATDPGTSPLVILLGVVVIASFANDGRQQSNQEMTGVETDEQASLSS